MGDLDLPSSVENRLQRWMSSPQRPCPATAEQNGGADCLVNSDLTGAGDLSISQDSVIQFAKVGRSKSSLALALMREPTCSLLPKIYER